MNNERYLALVDGYLSGDLTESETEELCNLLQADLALWKDFASQLQTSRSLDLLAKPVLENDTVDSVLSLISQQNRSRDPRVADEVIRRIARSRVRRAKAHTPNRLVWSVLSAAAVIILCLCTWMFGMRGEVVDSTIVATVVSVEGSQELRRAGKSVSLAAGDKINPGDELTSRDGGAVFRFADNTRVTAGNYSALMLQPANGAKEFFLSQGTITVDAAPQAIAKPLIIRTPHSEIKLVGTIVHVSVSVGLTRLQVVQGTVKMRSTQPDSAEVIVMGGRSAFARTGDAIARLEEGSSSPSGVKMQPGLWGEYFKDPAFEDLMLKRVDGPVQFQWSTGAPVVGMPKDHFSVRWSGYLIPPSSEEYRINAICDDSLRLWLEDEKGQLVLLFDRWTEYPGVRESATIKLKAGALHRIRVDYKEDRSYAMALFNWSTPSIPEQPIPLNAMLCRKDGPRPLTP